MNRLRRSWQRLRYRLHGAQYGHTALTDPSNVGFVIVCRHCDASQPDNLRDACATCGRDLRRQT